jgi:hypothetical protein
VHFINPAWVRWVHATVVSQVCGTLGVKQSPELPECRLIKLSILGPTSEPAYNVIFPQSSDDKFTRSFGTLSIILPSEFTGGNLSLFHAGKTENFDFAPNSSMSISTIASYNGVIQKLQPVRSGYQIALHYNLVHSSEICLSLPNICKPLKKLRHILLSWKQATGGYILKNRYPQLGLSMDALTDSDTHALSYFVPVAQLLGFRLYLSNINWNQARHGHKDDIELAHVVDLDGMPVHILGLNIKRMANLFGDNPLQNTTFSQSVSVKHSNCWLHYESF